MKNDFLKKYVNDLLKKYSSKDIENKNLLSSINKLLQHLNLNFNNIINHYTISKLLKKIESLNTSIKI